jgi:large subunit ribosomal protein L18
MATGPRYKVAFRRRRDNRTDYYKRKRILAGGELRAVVRRSSKNVMIQFAKFGMDGDKMITAATSAELKAFGWEHACSNIPAAYLTGYLAGTKAKKAGIEKAVLDLGMQTPAKGAVLFAALAGLIDSGISIPHGDVLPSDERLDGAHISETIRDDVDSVRVAIGGEKRERKQSVKPKTADAKKAEAKIVQRPAAKKADAKADPKAAKPAAKTAAKPAVKKKKEA